MAWLSELIACKADPAAKLCSAKLWCAFKTMSIGCVACLVCRGSCELQEAAVGQRLENGGMHEQVQHEHISNARQQQLPWLALQLFKHAHIGIACA